MTYRFKSEGIVAPSLRERIPDSLDLRLLWVLFHL